MRRVFCVDFLGVSGRDEGRRSLASQDVTVENENMGLEVMRMVAACKLRPDDHFPLASDAHDGGSVMMRLCFGMML